MTRILALCALALLATGCQSSPAGPRPMSPVVDHAVEGRKALAREDWATAARHLRLAIQEDSTEAGPHFDLAIAASWMDLRDEAAREFEWIVAHAPAGSDEVRIAREWLAVWRARRGVAGGGGESSAPDAPTADERVGGSGIRGRAVSDDGTPLERFQLHLYAMTEAGTSKGMVFHVRTDRDGYYTFARIPAGTYTLTDTNVTAPRWRLRVAVTDGQELQVDLTPQNSEGGGGGRN